MKEGLELEYISSPSMISKHWLYYGRTMMDTVSDYIKWMGNYSFAAVPFNELDALVLCMLSYYDMSPVFTEKTGDAVRVRDCQGIIENGEAQIRITGPDKGYLEIFRLAAFSERFGQLRMTDYVDILRLP